MDKVKYYQNPTNCKKSSVVETTPYNTHQPIVNKNNSKHIIRPQHTLFCNDEVTLYPNDPNYTSNNQRLAGPPNPKTKIPPVVTPPPAALDFWRANNLINHSHINTESQTDTYLSGYEVSNCCDRIDACIGPAKIPDNDIIEDFNESSYIGISDPNRPAGPKCNPLQNINTPIIPPTPTVSNNSFSENIKKHNGNKEGYEGYARDYREPLPPQHLQHIQQIKSPQPYTENFEMPYIKNNQEMGIRDNESGWVNTLCGYNPDQINNSNLPSNLEAGNCERSPEMKEYNKNLFTQNIQPDVYTQNQIIEPINSNMGISFTQQFEPLTCTRDSKGLTYTEHDPRVFNPDIEPRKPDMSVTEANIYDPRFYGYGTSYRSYTDNLTGQTRFYYDDINSVRMPNYIVRSNIDFVNYADSYGPLHDNNKNGNQYNSNIRALAQDTFLTYSLKQRDDLQERLMRKRNAELWQTRKYPMRTFGGKK